MTLRIAVIGGGAIGREHVARIRANPRCAVAAVVDPSPTAADWARAEGLAHHPELDALWPATPPDAAIVATPNALHVRQAIALLRRAVPVLVEKPVADDLASGLELLRVARDTGVAALVGHHRRHSAAVAAARDCVAAGRLGRLVAVQVSTLFHKPDAYFDTVWRRGPDSGPILINAVHDIDSLRAIAGPSAGEVVAVQAAASSAVRGFAVEDTAAAVLEFGHGALGTLLVSDATVSPRSWEQTSGENPAYARDATQDHLFIAGTEGSLAVPTMQLWRQAGARAWTQPFLTERLLLEAVDPLARQLDHFCDVVSGHAAPQVSVLEGLRSLAVTLAVRDAARQRTRVAVPVLE